MAEKILLIYLNYLIIIFIGYPVLCLSVAGIEGLKDAWDMLTHKYYYLKVALPILILVTFCIVISFLITLFINKINL